jgi:hypothetical protein
MKRKTAWGIGLAVATLVHVLFCPAHLPSVLAFPGLIAHPLIAGLHGGSAFDPLELLASAGEIVINGTLYMFVILGVSRIVPKLQDTDVKLRLQNAQSIFFSPKARDASPSIR